MTTHWAYNIRLITVALLALSLESAVADVVIEGKPGTYTNIQDAIDAAVAGDVILATNTTFPAFTITKPVTVRGAGSGMTIIDSAGASGTSIVAEASFVLEDLTVTGAGAGVVWDAPDVTGTVRRCEFTALENVSLGLSSSSVVLAEDNKFHANHTGPFMSVLFITPGSIVTFQRNEVRGNSTAAYMIFVLGNVAAVIPSLDTNGLTRVSVRNNLFAGNDGGILGTEGIGQIVDIVNNTIAYNTIAEGAVTESFAAPILIGSKDAGDQVVDSAYFSHTIMNNIITGNLTNELKAAGATALTLGTNVLGTTVIKNNLMLGTFKMKPGGGPPPPFDPSNFVAVPFVSPPPEELPLKPESLFVDPIISHTSGMTSEAGDFNLMPIAKAIDAGTGTAPGASPSATDLDGKARITDGDGDMLDEIDMGCYEFEASGGGGGGGGGGDVDLDDDGSTLIVSTTHILFLITAVHDLASAVPSKFVTFVLSASASLSEISDGVSVVDAMDDLVSALASLKPVEKSAPEVEPVEEDIADFTATLASSTVFFVDTLIATPPAAEAKLSQAYRMLEQGDEHLAEGRYQVAALQYRAAVRLAQDALQIDRAEQTE